MILCADPLHDDGASVKKQLFGPLHALTPEGKPFEGIGHSDEPFRMECREDLHLHAREAFQRWPPSDITP